MLAEFHTADSLELRRLYRSYWSGMHAACSDRSSAKSLGAKCQAVNVHTRLVTDARHVAEHSLAAEFSSIEQLPEAHAQASAAEVAETTIAQFAIAASEAIEQIRAGELLWLHSHGLSGPWDAPLEFRQALADEEDPDPLSIVAPPNERLGANPDPDILLGLNQAYGAQVMVLDQCLGLLLDILDESDLPEETLVIFTSPRGFPLGEHGVVGSAGERLFAESLATPLFILRSDGLGAGERVPYLSQPVDVFDTLFDWFEIPCDDQVGQSLIEAGGKTSTEWRQQVCSLTENEKSIRTPAWFLRSAEAETQLYVKPDDRWEVNDVATRCPTITTSLHHALDEYVQLVQADQLEKLPPLANELLDGLPQ